MFLCCAAGSVVKTFEVTTKSIVHQCTCNSLQADVTSVQYNHNGRILASSSVNGELCLHVASSGEMLSQFSYPGAAPDKRQVNGVQFSSGSRFLASGGNDGFIRLWDLKTQEVTQMYNISASAVTSVAFSGYKDECIVGGTVSGAIYICNVQTAETVGYLTVDTAHGVHQVTAMQASPHPSTRHTLGATYSDGSVRVWNLATGQLTAEFVRQHEAPATSLTLSSVSKVLLASGGFDGRVIFYDTLQRKELRSLDLEQPVSSLALCADGKTLAVGTTTGEVHLYDLRGAITPLFSTLVHETFAVQSLDFAPPVANVNASSLTSQGIPVKSFEPTSPRNDNTLHEIAPRRLETLEMSFPTGKSPDSLRVATTPTQSPTQVATRFIKPSDRVSPQKQMLPSTQQPSTEAILSLRSKLATTHEPTDETLRIGPSPLSPMNGQSLKPADRVSKATSSQQSDFTHTMRTEIRRHREEIEQQRCREDIDQLSTMLETLMDRYDAVVEENRSLRQENDWLKSHVPAL